MPTELLYLEDLAPGMVFKAGPEKISEADIVRKEVEHKLLHLGIRHSVIQMECAECETNGTYCQITHSQPTHHH